MKAQQLQPDSGLSYVKESEPSKQKSNVTDLFQDDSVTSLTHFITAYYCKDLIDSELVNNLRLEIPPNFGIHILIPTNTKLASIVTSYINWSRSIKGFDYWFHIYQSLITQNL